EIYKVMEYYNALDLTGDSTEYTLRDIFELYCDTQYYDNNIESELIEDLKKKIESINVRLRYRS
ncbi:MAG: hypothetical protein ACRC7S_17415, partial [Cetobacterium sp.]